MSAGGCVLKAEELTKDPGNSDLSMSFNRCRRSCSAASQSALLSKIPDQKNDSDGEKNKRTVLQPGNLGCVREPC